MSGEDTFFLTGFPGFIAGKLLRRLAQKSPASGQILLLVQPSLAQLAREDVEKIAASTGKPSQHFRILEGDITLPNLGLTPADLDLAQRETTLVFHLAALYDLGVVREPAMLVNVTGTQNVNSFVRSLKQLRHYHYVSTCYVAGLRQGLILETELIHEAGFRNYYEETKYLAEVQVEKLKADLPITIHRPSVVCGDSVTGETVKFDGVYYLINYLRKWPALISVLNIGNRDVQLNLVPVDFVVNSLAALAKDPNAIGKTLQLADPKPLSTEELFDTLARELAGHESRVTLPKPLVQFSLMSKMSPPLTGLPHSAVPYFFLNQTYGTELASALLRHHGVFCPAFPSYARNLIDYMQLKQP